MSRPRCLDLFCGAGGAAMGLHRAGFDVVGIDIKPQTRYPFPFIQGDALKPPVRLEDFDLVWASPPCQRWASIGRNKDRIPDLLTPTRTMLDEYKTHHAMLDRPPTRCYVIENVLAAPLRDPIVCCGSGCGLKTWRHRAFELFGFNAPSIMCNHDSVLWPYDVTGTGGRRRGPRKDGGGGNPRKPNNRAEVVEAMGIDWMTRAEAAQAIPPAYSEHIGKYAMIAIGEGGRVKESPLCHD